MPIKKTILLGEKLIQKGLTTDYYLLSYSEFHLVWSHAVFQTPLFAAGAPALSNRYSTRLRKHASGDGSFARLPGADRTRLHCRHILDRPKGLPASPASVELFRWRFPAA